LRIDFRIRIPVFLVLAAAVCAVAAPAPGSAFTAAGKGPSAAESAVPAPVAAAALLPDDEISLVRTLVAASLLRPGLSTGMPDAEGVQRRIDGLADRLRRSLGDRSDPRQVVSTLNRFLFVEEGFRYDPVAGDPENYLLDRVLERRQGNCLGLTMLYLALAERLGLPLRGAYVPSHCFPRYEDGAVRINIECADGGAERSDATYARDFRIRGDGPYLRSLGKREMIGVYLKSLGAAYSRRGMDEQALWLYGAASEFYPGLPDVHFNAGVSHHKAGRVDEAIVHYRRALFLDPDLAVARDNLGVALARKGAFEEALREARRAVALDPGSAVSRGNLAVTLCAAGRMEEGMREFRRVLETDPGNARALAGLAKAHYVRGEYRQAIEHCDRATTLGCRFDTAMLAALERHRASIEPRLP
jgi:Tfp pilus assembly protein PilF